MPDSLPLVSVIATCFNHERYVVESLESIRAQTYPNIQLIVADDASTDGSVELIRDWARETAAVCSFVFHEENQGVCRMRNDALAHARGDYVAGISTDDLWLPDRIAVGRSLSASRPLGLPAMPPAWTSTVSRSPASSSSTSARFSARRRETSTRRCSPGTSSPPWRR
jgi:GT2 family glycosyltransferase